MEFINLKSQYIAMKAEIDESIQNVLNRSQFIMGECVDEFEEMLSKFLSVKHCITCSDGTAALQLIFMAYGIGKGDAIFCPDITFIASVEPACMLGATPVFCDIEPLTYNLNASSLENQINATLKESTLIPKAIICVDIFGNPVDYDKIRKIAQKYNLLVIEDAAQAMGASFRGELCGSLGDVSATSFFPTKPLGCYGDGGAVFTNDDNIAEIIKSLRIHGKGKDKYDTVRIGMNSRLDSIQAAVLIIKLKAFSNEIKMRENIAQRYNEALKKHYIIPHISASATSVYAQYVIMSKSDISRSEIMSYLKGEGIPTISYYSTPMHQLPVFTGLNIYEERFENTLNYCKNAFAIPFSPYMTDIEQKNVIDALLFFSK